MEMEPRVHLFEPFVVSGAQKLTLTVWPKPQYTEERHILLHSDSLLTVCDPTDELRDMYLKKVKRFEQYEKEREEQLSQVLLQEDEQAVLDNNDDYEPRYVEERNEY